METRIVTLSNVDNKESILKAAGEIVKRGGLVAFPTETVYGLGGDALSRESARKIYEAKGRPSDNPLIIHISCWHDIDKIVKEVTPKVKKLAEVFWPGPLTIVLNKSEAVPKETTGGLETVAVRIPSHPAAREFIRYAGGYVAAPSANLSGRPSPTRAKYVVEDMQGKIDMILADDSVDIGLESTIIDMTGKVPMVLRPGAITPKMLSEILGEVQMDPTLLDVSCSERPRAPGMCYRHYAPKAPLIIVEGDSARVVKRINELRRESKDKGQRVGVICADETRGLYEADSIKSVGSRQDEEAIGRSLYRILREFDEEDIQLIYSESFDRGEMGQAIMNRLLKAAGHQVISAGIR